MEARKPALSLSKPNVSITVPSKSGISKNNAEPAADTIDAAATARLLFTLSGGENNGLAVMINA